MVEEVFADVVDQLHLGGSEADGEVEVTLVTEERQHLELSKVNGLKERGERGKRERVRWGEGQ